MTLTYKECIALYGSDYQIKKEISAGKLFKIERGLYSTDNYFSNLETIYMKYPETVFTGKSAFYYLGLSDVIPNEYTLASRRTYTRIKKDNIIQIFVNDDLFDLYRKKMNYRGSTINIYCKERMLVDLIRFRNRYSFDYYKEVINNYRKIVNTLDFMCIEDYASNFRNCKSILRSIELEVL
ncbi:MAG: hypothetical protein ACI4WM_01825 [Erysipelotrichaceae bacterium]